MAIIEKRPPNSFWEQPITPMSPVPPEEVRKAANENTLYRRIMRRIAGDPAEMDPGRRAILRGIVGASGLALTGETVLVGAKLFLDIDAEHTERKLVPREGSVQFVNRETYRQYPFRTTLMYRGFNVDQIDTAGVALSPHLSQYGQVASVDYGNQNFDLDQITENTIRFCKDNNISIVNLWGRSMGGMVALRMVEPLRKEKIEIESMLFECSPTSRADVIGSEDSDAVFIEAYNELVRLGKASYGGDTIREYVDKGANDIMHRRDPRKPHGGTRSKNELPNAVAMQQLGFIGTFSIDDETAALMQDIPVGYFAALQDTTVDCGKAVQNLRSQLPGCTMMLYEFPGVAHASASDHPDLYGNAAIDFRKTFHLPPWYRT